MKLLWRHILLRNYLLSRRSVSAEALKLFYEDQMGGIVGKRTVERDLSFLRENMGLKIKYHPKNKKYEVNRTEWKEMQELEKHFSDVTLVDALKNGKDMTFSRTNNKTNWNDIGDLLIAIQTQNIIQIRYESPGKPERDHRLRPLHLRESEGRWYLIARPDKPEYVIAAYGLDRIRKIKRMEGEVFTEEPKFDYFEHFKRFVGVWVDKEKKPEQVILEFRGHLGKYLLDYPIHFSQDVISHEGDTIQLRLNVVINQDLINILLRHGDQMRILQPQYLREQYVSLLRTIIDNNSSIQ